MKICLCVSPVINSCQVQGVSCLTPEDSRHRLNMINNRKWVDGLEDKSGPTQYDQGVPHKVASEFICKLSKQSALSCCLKQQRPAPKL